MTDDEIKRAAVEVVSSDVLATSGSKRVRVTRVLVYEGPADEVRRQLAQSKPVGPQRIGTRDLTLDVYQGETVLADEPVRLAREALEQS